MELTFERPYRRCAAGRRQRRGFDGELERHPPADGRVPRAVHLLGDLASFHRQHRDQQRQASKSFPGRRRRCQQIARGRSEGGAGRSRPRLADRDPLGYARCRRASPRAAERGQQRRCRRRGRTARDPPDHARTGSGTGRSSAGAGDREHARFPHPPADDHLARVARFDRDERPDTAHPSRRAERALGGACPAVSWPRRGRRVGRALADTRRDDPGERGRVLRGSRGGFCGGDRRRQARHPGRELQAATKRTRALMLKPDAHTVAVRYKPKHAA